MIKGIDFESYEKLQPVICVLKSGTQININTASVEVLSSLVKDITLEDAKSFVEDRDKEAYKKVEDFLKHPLLKSTKIKKEGLSVSSQYFQLNSTAQIERISVEYVSVLQRDSDGRMTILKRSRSVL